MRVRGGERAPVCRWLRPLLATAAIGIAIGAAVVVTSRPVLAAPTCSDTWLGGVDGNFGTAGNWSTAAVPGSSDDTCITATTMTSPAAVADTYTVTLNGSFTVHSLTLGGPNGTQTLLIPANNDGLGIQSDSSVGSNGVLTLGDAGTGYSLLGNSTLTNAGHLNTVMGGGGNRYLRLNVTNAAGGRIDVAGNAVQDAFNGSTTFVNSGTLTIEATGTLALSPGNGNTASFTNSAGNITNNGTLSQAGGTFTQRSGTESGNPVQLGAGVALDDDLTAGAALFTFTSPSDTLTGTGASPGVASGQVVTVGTSAGVATPVNFTNAGTIVLAAGGSNALGNPGRILTNTGTLSSLAGAFTFLRMDVTNAATGTIDIAGTVAQDGFNGATATVNNGGLSIEVSGLLSLSGGSTFTQGAAGTLSIAIDANTSGFGRLTGAGDPVTIAGKLRVTTTGVPSIGSAWPIISGASRSGGFASQDFGSSNYFVQYPPTGVTLVAYSILFFPAVMNHAYGGYTTTIYLQNLSGSALPSGAINISYYDQTGAAVGIGDSSPALANNGVWAVSQSNGHSFASGFAGSGRVNTTVPVVAFVNQEIGTADGSSYSALPQPATGATVYAPAVFRNAYGGYTTAMGITNTGPTATDVTVTYRDQSGAAVGSPTVIHLLAPNAYYGLYQGTESQLPNGFKGTATLTTSPSSNLAVIVNETGPGGFLTYTAVNSGATTQYVPIVFNDAYGGYFTGIGLQNLSPAAANVTISYSGTAAGVPVSKTETFGIAPSGYAGDYNGPGNAAGLPDGFAGSATIVSSQPLGIIVNEVRDGYAYGTSYNAFSTGGLAVHLPLVENAAGGFSTGLAIENIGTAPATVTITYLDQTTGNQIGSGPTVNLQPGAFAGVYQGPGGDNGVPPGSSAAAVITVTNPVGGKLAVIVNQQSGASFMSYSGQ